MKEQRPLQGERRGAEQESVSRVGQDEAADPLWIQPERYREIGSWRIHWAIARQIQWPLGIAVQRGLFRVHGPRFNLVVWREGAT